MYVRRMSNKIPGHKFDEVKDVAVLMKALSNPYRLLIYKELIEYHGERVTEVPDKQVQECQRSFADRLGIAASTLNHHYKELRQAGLIHMERRGKNVAIWIDQKALRSVQVFFSG